MPDLDIRTSAEFDRLAATIKKICAGRAPVYFPNPGNWGDSLIRAGTIEFFLYHDIPFTAAYRKQYRLKKPWPLMGLYNVPVLKRLAQQHDVAIYGGGGAWSASHSAGGHAFVAELCKYFKQVVVLPTSFQRPAVPGPVTYFARDTTMSKQSIATALFCHDMAFFLQPPELPATKDIGYFLRTDRESLHQLGGVAGNFDISRVGDELSDVRQFFVELSRFKTIVTDRLHVSIAGGLLKRDTFLLAGAYWKNASVHESSLKSLCPSVRFATTAKDLPATIAKHLHLADERL
jgi:exopolysaccharide biosynthesis predicted pyruvyltransferase EpsI